MEYFGCGHSLVTITGIITVVISCHMLPLKIMKLIRKYLFIVVALAVLNFLLN